MTIFQLLKRHPSLNNFEHDLRQLSAGKFELNAEGWYKFALKKVDQK